MNDFKNSVVESLSLRVDTPTGLNGKIKLVVTPVDLNSEGGLATTAASQSKLFKLDNTAPVINIDAYQESGGNKTGGIGLNMDIILIFLEVQIIVVSLKKLGVGINLVRLL